MIGAEQIASFRRDGYLVVEDLVPPDELRRLREQTAELHERLASSSPRGVVVSWEPTRTAEGQRRVQQVLNAHKVSSALDGFVRSEPVVSAVSALVGPDVALFEAKFLLKASEVGGEIPWHQDYAYWRSFSPGPVQVNCMLYIDDADEENGCLEVVPRSHLAGLRPHGQLATDSIFSMSVVSQPGAAPGVRPLAVPGKAGTAIFFGPLLMHHSKPNTSTRARRSATIVYTTAGVGDREIEVLRERRETPDLRAIVPFAEIPRFTGSGPHAGQCELNYRRRELWKLAAESVRDPSRIWIDVAYADSDGSSLEWFAAHKPKQTALRRYEPTPTLPNRDDVAFVRGAPEEALATASTLPEASVGLLHLDTPTYAPTRLVLEKLSSALGPGSVIVIDRFYGARGWHRQAALAFHEWLEATGWSAEYLGRATTQVAARLRRGGPRHAAAAQPERRIATHGIGIDFDPTSEGERAAVDRPKKTLRLRLRRLLRSAGRKLRRRFRAAPPSAYGADGLAISAETTVTELFRPAAIPVFVGDGPTLSLCPTHARRRELWRYAVSQVRDDSLTWCEFGVGEGESFDWFALHKPRRNLLFGFDTFQGLPEPWGIHPVGHWSAPTYAAERDDIRIVVGLYRDRLAEQDVLDALGAQVGLVHVDCDLYSSTCEVLAALRNRIGAGTVIVFDELYNYPGWEEHEAKALLEFVQRERVELEWLARSDFQVAVRIVSVGLRAHCRVKPFDGEPATSGVFASVPA